MTALFTTGLSFIYQNLWHYGSYCINAMAFDCGTNIMVSMFGYSMNAGFAKNKPQGGFSIKSAARKIAKSTTKGTAIIHSFNNMVNWLITNSFTIIWSCIIALIVILVVRYLVTHLFYSASRSTKRAKRK